MDWDTLMDFRLTVEIIVAVVAIMTLVVLARQHKKKMPTWSYTTRQVIGRDAESPPELKYIFGTTEVEEVYETTLIFFNSGSEKYCGDLVQGGISDINEAIVIEFRGAKILRQPVIKNKSKGVANKFSVEKIIKDGVESVELHFPILGHNDGALIEIWHTRLEEKPDIPNADVKLLREFIRERPKNLYRATIASSIFIVFFLIVAGFALASFESFYESIPVLVLFAIFLIAAVRDMLKTFRYQKFPGWSRMKEK